LARTVLVADDSPTVQKKASGILTGEGLEVVTVSNGVAAIKKLPIVKPLLVLADGSMPGKDGYEVCEFVKNSPELSHIPVLLIVSELEPYDVERGARVRADGKVTKPFDPEELISSVNKFLPRAEAAAPTAATVITAPQPAPSVVTEPVDEEPEIQLKEQPPDFGSLSEGVAFAEPALEEVPATRPEAAAAPPEPLMEAEISPFPPPAAEMAPVPTEEETPAAPPPEMPPIPAEPVLIEEPAAPQAVPPEPPPAPPAERTMMFRMPANIAEPVLSDELAPAPPPVAAEAEMPPIAATTLESFSLDQATAGRVQFAAAEAEAVAAPEAALVEPEAAAVAAEVSAAAPLPGVEAAAAPLDAAAIFSIVRKVVMKMSPPALPTEMIEEMVRKLSDEVIAELNAESSPNQ
jgi:CheY-like chemotaxis protein